MKILLILFCYIVWNILTFIVQSHNFHCWVDLWKIKANIDGSVIYLFEYYDVVDQCSIIIKTILMIFCLHCFYWLPIPLFFVYWSFLVTIFIFETYSERSRKTERQVHYFLFEFYNFNIHTVLVLSILVYA